MKKSTIKLIKRISREVYIPKAKVKESGRVYKRSRDKSIHRE